LGRSGPPEQSDGPFHFARAPLPRPGGRATAITVKNIRADGDTCVADVKYAWGALGESELVREAGSLDVKGSIEGSYLYVPLIQYDASARFTPESDTILSGIWRKDGYGDPLPGTFKRQE